MLSKRCPYGLETKRSRDEELQIHTSDPSSQTQACHSTSIDIGFSDPTLMSQAGERRDQHFLALCVHDEFKNKENISCVWKSLRLLHSRVCVQLTDTM